MKSLTIIFLLAGLLSIVGCATKPPTFGDRVRAEGQSQIDIADQWEKGESRSVAGEKQVQKGQKRVEKGRASVREGEQLVSSGNAKVQINRQAHQTLSQSATNTDSGEMVLDRNAELKKIAKAWDDGEKMIVNGNKLIKRGNADISKGEAEIQKGKKSINKGRDKKQDAESHFQENPQ